MTRKKKLKPGPELLAGLAANQEARNPYILQRGKYFDEALHQANPAANPGAEAARLKNAILGGNGRLSPEAAEAMALRAKDLQKIFAGAHPKGKAAEVIVVQAYKDLHAGDPSQIVNPPSYVAKNLKDIRISPDDTSPKDLLFKFTTEEGVVIFKMNGQVKNGSSQYITDSLVEMTTKEGYGKIGMIDAKFVNPDGTPRVASDGFTELQAAKLRDAKVQLRGIKDLETNADTLLKDVKGGDPNFKSIANIRDKIVNAYKLGGVGGRVVTGAGIAAITACIVSLTIQLATSGKVDLQSLGTAAGVGALYGGGAVAVDALIFHAAAAQGLAPEAAKQLAGQVVSTGFCVLAIGMDAFDEYKAYKEGRISGGDAIAGTLVKGGLDLLPLILAPLGLAAIPIVIVAQIGGRWLLNWYRNRKAAIHSLHLRLDDIDHRVEVMKTTIRNIDRESAEVDRLFEAHVAKSHLTYFRRVNIPDIVQDSAEVDSLFQQYMNKYHPEGA